MKYPYSEIRVARCAATILRFGIFQGISGRALCGDNVERLTLLIRVVCSDLPNTRPRFSGIITKPSQISSQGGFLKTSFVSSAAVIRRPPTFSLPRG